MKQFNIIFGSILSILLLTISVLNFTDVRSILKLILELLLFLYVSKMFFEFSLTVLKISIYKYRGGNINSLSIFPIIIFRSRNKWQVSINHFYTLKNRTYGSKVEEISMLRSVKVVKMILLFTFVGTIYLLLNEYWSYAIVTSLVLYNLVTFANFEVVYTTNFDKFYYVLYLQEPEPKVYNQILKQIEEAIEKNSLYIEELKFITYYVVSSYKINIILPMELNSLITSYVMKCDDSLLSVMYLEFMYVSIYCSNVLNQGSNVAQLKKMLIKFVDTLHLDYSETSNFRISGRLLRNYDNVLNNKYNLLETRNMYRLHFK